MLSSTDVIPGDVIAPRAGLAQTGIWSSRLTLDAAGNTAKLVSELRNKDRALVISVDEKYLFVLVHNTYGFISRKLVRKEF